MCLWRVDTPDVSLFIFLLQFYQNNTGFWLPIKLTKPVSRQEVTKGSANDSSLITQEGNHDHTIIAMKWSKVLSHTQCNYSVAAPLYSQIQFILLRLLLTCVYNNALIKLGYLFFLQVGCTVLISRLFIFTFSNLQMWVCLNSLFS